MQNFEDIVFMYMNTNTQTYGNIFNSALVYL